MSHQHHHLPAFPAEHMLQADLPNWEWEVLRLKGLICVAALVWWFGWPSSTNRSSSSSSSHTATPSASAVYPEKQSHAQPPVVVAYRRHWCLVGVSFVGRLLGFAITAVALVLFLSPYNAYTSRRVFQVPIMSPAECQRIIDIAFATAERNVQKLSRKRDLGEEWDDADEKLMEDPAGWQKKRHQQYPTNDLNLVTDPFTAEDQDWLRQVADQRLAPILSRVFGIPARSIQARDMFVVRYDADTSRAQLAKHTDGGDISFTIFLNHEFEGGGTQFWNRHTKEPFGLVQSDTAGHMSTFSARIEHEGYPTTKGRRMIMVGFLNVDRYDEDEKTPTGLSLFASWLNLNWAMTRIKDAYTEYDWAESPYKWWRKKVYRLILFVEKWHDRLAVHVLTPSLVDPERVPEFLRVLEGNYNGTNRAGKARWLEGQQKSAFLKFLDAYYDEEEDEDEGDEYNDEEEEEEEEEEGDEEDEGDS